jgi:hypothetical protein
MNSVFHLQYWRKVMVYCTKCGTKNEDGTEFCAKCGAPLSQTAAGYKRTERYRREGGCFGPRERRPQDECFGLPHGGAIVGIIFGIFLIIVGLAIYFNVDLGNLTGPFILIVIGTLVVAGAIYGYNRYNR